MKQIFIVCYSSGDCDNLSIKTIFATTNEKTAQDYIDKFNNILNKWKEYFEQFKDNEGYLINDAMPINLDRYYQINEINEAYYYEIEKR